MRAIRLHAFGTAPRVDELAAPAIPVDDELAVNVTAVGIGAWDAGVLSGRLERFVRAPLPVTLGAELVGTVTGVGAGVNGFTVGDRVTCNPGIVGAWAEQVTVAADRCGLAPASLDDAHAAALPVGALTAKQSLDRLAPAPGTTLLVLGAGGSVGRAAIQLAAGRGLTVHAVSPSHELDRSRALGAQGAYDAAQDWPGELQAAAEGGLDAVLDLVGGDTLRRSVPLLRDGSRIVTTLSDASIGDGAAGVTLEHVHMRSRTEDLNAIAFLVDQGRLQMPVARVLRFDDIPAELGRAGSRDRAGKLVATM